MLTPKAWGRRASAGASKPAVRVQRRLQFRQVAHVGGERFARKSWLCQARQTCDLAARGWGWAGASR
eukprot:11665807-Alexandrium_andersonii.AAC.1